MEQRSKIWYLENFNFFAELTMDHRKFVRSNTLMKSVKKGETIYFQEHAANGIYFLKEGKIRLSRFDPEGNELIMGFLEAGEIFGESSVVSDQIRKESAIAEEEVIYCMMKEEKMRELLLMVPSLNLSFSEMLEKRREREQKRLTDLSFKSNQQRIIDFIRELAWKSAQAGNGELVLENNFTHEQIAKLTSTNRQEVSSVFCKLKKEGVIDYDRKSIRVLNRSELEVICK